MHPISFTKAALSLKISFLQYHAQPQEFTLKIFLESDYRKAHKVWLNGSADQLKKEAHKVCTSFSGVSGGGNGMVCGPFW